MKCFLPYFPTDIRDVDAYRITKDNEFENGSIIDDLYLVCEADIFEAATMKPSKETFKEGWITRVFALPFIPYFYTDVKHDKDYLKIMSENYMDGEHVYYYENMKYDPHIEWEDFIALQNQMTHELYKYDNTSN